MFRGVDRKLVDGEAKRQRGVGRQLYLRPRESESCASVWGEWAELLQKQLAQLSALPLFAGEQAVGLGKGDQAGVEGTAGGRVKRLPQ